MAALWWGIDRNMADGEWMEWITHSSIKHCLRVQESSQGELILLYCILLVQYFSSIYFSMFSKLFKLVEPTVPFLEP